MSLLLALACAPDCHPGFRLVDGECVATGDGSDDTDEPDDTDTDTDTTDIDPGASPGHYSCDAGFGHGFGGDALRGLCGVCTNIACTWTVSTVEDHGAVGSVEIDLYSAGIPNPDPWREYHDEFVSVLADGDGTNWAIELEVVLEPDDYESNATTWVDPRDPDVAAGLTAQANAFDGTGAFLDCFTWGPDAEAVFGRDCTVVE